MNKVIMVTGAGRGLGYNIALQHLEMNDRVYAYDYRVTDELQALAEKYDQLKVYNCDISSTDSVTEATKEVLANEKQVDILYNVAGIFRHEEKVYLEDTNLDDCLSMYNINAVGPMRVCKAALPLLEKGSVIINISSEAGSIGLCRREQEYSYCMSKAALNMGAKILSNYLSKRSVRLISIHPGWMRTFMGGEAAKNSPNGVNPEDSARNIIGIALDAENIPGDQVYMQHNRELMPW